MNVKFRLIQSLISLLLLVAVTYSVGHATPATAGVKQFLAGDLTDAGTSLYESESDLDLRKKILRLSFNGSNCTPAGWRDQANNLFPLSPESCRICLTGNFPKLFILFHQFRFHC